MLKRIFWLFGGLVITMQFFAGASFAFDISGTVHNGTSNSTSNVYVVVMNSGQSYSSGFGTTIANIPAGGTSPTFTIHGVPAGQYQLAAFMDVNNTGSLHYNDPFILGGSFTISGSNVNVGQLALPAITSSPTSVTAPKHVNVVTTSDAALITWGADNPQISGANGLSAELADSYTIYWGTKPNPGNGNAPAGSKIVPAIGNDYHPVITGLTPGSVLYFTVKATNSGGASNAFSPSVGPFTIAAASGGATVTGRVYSSGIAKSAATPLYIAMQGQNTGNFYITHVASPTDTQSWTITTGVQPDTYNVYVILDMNNDGMSTNFGYITSPGVGGGDVASPFFTVPSGASAALAPDVTLTASNSTTIVNTQNFNNSSYALSFLVAPATKRPVSATVNSGPNISGPLDLGLPLGNSSKGAEFGNGHGQGLSISTKPIVGDTYSVKVNYSDSSSDSLTPKVTGVVSSLPTLTFPTDQSTTTAINTNTPFAWQTASSLPNGYYDYYLWLNTTTPPFNQVWAPQNNSNANMPSTQLSIPFNSDGSASPSTLNSGTYGWSISQRDQFGNQGQSFASFNPTGSGLSISSFIPTAGGGAGTSVTINGSGFTGTSNVSFGGINAPGFSVNSDNQITVSVPSGAPAGPITVTKGGVTTVSPTPFPATVTFTGGATNFGGTAISGATATVVNSNPTNFTTTSGGSFTLTVPSGVPFSILIHDGVHHDTLTSIMNFTTDYSSLTSYTLFSDSDISPYSVASKGFIYTRVRDWDTSNPLQGVTIKATSFLHPDTPYTVSYSSGTSTAGDGKFFVPNLDEGDLVTITGTLANYYVRSTTYVSHIGVVSSGRVPSTPFPTGIATPAGGIITISQTISLSVTNPIGGISYSIWYTTDGSDPTVSGGTRTLYSSPFTLNSGNLLKFYVNNNTHGVAGNVVTANYTVVTSAPGAPTNVTAKADNGQSTVSFTASTGPVDHYTVTSNPPGGNDSQLGSAATTHTITGLTNSTPYTFTVTATNGAGTSPPAASTDYYALNVSTNGGTGSGTVNSNPGGINCPSGFCQNTFSANSTASLSPTVANGSQFGGWSGPCQEILTTCNVTMNALFQSVSAIFNLSSNVQIFNSTQTFSLLSPAFQAAATSGTIIEAAAVTLVENPTFNAAKSVVILGGLDSTFSSQTGYTTVQGIFTIALGSILADHIIIQ